MEGAKLVVTKVPSSLSSYTPSALLCERLSLLTISLENIKALDFGSQTKDTPQASANLVTIFENALITAQSKAPKTFQDLSARPCAIVAVQLIEQASDSGYLHTTRKTTQIPYKIISSPDKQMLLFQPKKKPSDQSNSGMAKVGRRAIVLKKQLNEWQSAVVFTLTSKKGANQASFKDTFEYESKLYSFPGTEGIFPEHLFSGVFSTKPYKRLGLYENLPHSLFDWVFEDGHSHLNEKLACDLLHKVGVLHEKKLLHGDIKLENILVADDGTVKLCDLDFARSESELGCNPSKGGTLEYLAPERIQALISKETFKGDSFKAEAYSLGCVLYALHFKAPAPWTLHTSRLINLHTMKKKQQTIKASAVTAKEFFLTLPPKSPDLVKNIALWMLDPDPTTRPCLQEICSILRSDKGCK